MYYFNFYDDYNVADPSHDGTMAHPFCYDECNTLVGGAAVNDTVLVDGDTIRIRGGREDDGDVFDSIQMSLTITSWPDRAYWWLYGHTSSSPSVLFTLANAGDTLHVYDAIVDSIRADAVADGNSISFYNCLSWGVRLDSNVGGDQCIYRFDNCTIAHSTRAERYGCVYLVGAVAGGLGEAYFTDCVFEDSYFIDIWTWNIVQFTNVNIFSYTQANADQLAGTVTELGWDLCTFSYDISAEIPNLDDLSDLDINDLTYYNFNLPLVFTQPARWDTDDIREGWYNYRRYGYGAFYFPFEIDVTVDPIFGTEPLLVTFTADAPDVLVDENDGYSWDFGDGTESSEKDTEHEYVAGVYSACVTVTSLWGEEITQCTTIYVYENDYTPGGRNVTKTTRCVRFAIPQEKKQGNGWSEYNGDDYPNAIGLVGACKFFTDNDEERVVVTDCNSFKHYWLGREDHWVDGGNADYGGSEINSDILFRELNGEATAKIRHSESEANLKPWFKDRRNTSDYNEFGFRENFRSSMYFREDSSPTDRAEVRYFPRRAQIVSDRHIESECLQAGLRLTGAPWRLVDIQQYYQEIDTAAAPPQKQMSEKTWAEMLADSVIWIGRNIELVSLTDGSHTMPWDNGSNQRTTGDFAGVTEGPDGNSRSGIVFEATDSMVTDTDIPAGDLSVIMWLRSPTSPCTILSTATLAVRLVNDGGWKVTWDDGTNTWEVPLSVALTRWTMLVITRHADIIEVYENGAFANTRYLTENLGYDGPVTFYGGAVTGFEPRVVASRLTADAIRWIYDDVVENSGNSTCAMY